MVVTEPIVHIPGTRTMTYLVSDADNQIQEYTSKFKDLMSAFRDHGILHVNVAVCHILDRVDDHGKHIFCLLPVMQLMVLACSIRSPT